MTLSDSDLLVSRVMVMLSSSSSSSSLLVLLPRIGRSRYSSFGKGGGDGGQRAREFGVGGGEGKREFVIGAGREEEEGGGEKGDRVASLTNRRIEGRRR